VPSNSKGRTADRVKRVVRADGSIAEYRYPAKLAAPKPKPGFGDTVEGVATDWQRSPAWQKLAASSKNTYCYNILPLLKLAGMEPIMAVTRRALLDIRDDILVNRGPGAARSFCGAVSSLWSWAIDNDRPANHNAVWRLAKALPAKGELPAWTVEEVRLALRYLPERLCRVIWLAMWTGQRRGDLIAMCWVDFDERTGTLWVVQEKTGSKVSIPLHPVLREALLRWRPANFQPTDRILLTDSGQPWSAANLSTTMSNYLDTVPGFPEGKNVHGLRKLAATMLAMAGCSVHQIMSITGHKTIAMVQHYTASVEQAATAEQAMGKLLLTQGTNLWDETGRMI